MSLTNDTQCAHCGSDCIGHSYWIGSNGPLCEACTMLKTEFMATPQSHESFFIKRIRELEAELQVRDNSANEVLRILREATGKRDFHSEMEAVEWAAKLLAEAQTQEKLAQRLADLSAGRELEAVQRAAELEAQLAEARLDSARLDCVLKFMNDQRQFWLFLYLHKTKLQTVRGDADLDEWRKWIDAAIDAAIKEAK